jgi:hypothetical protein
MLLLTILAIQTLIQGSKGFFYDEAWVANSVQTDTLEEMLFYEKVAQNTPGGLLLLMRGATSLLGDQEWIYRFPALLGTLLCIPLLVHLGRALKLPPSRL